jgi:hypothetical protein
MSKTESELELEPEFIILVKEGIVQEVYSKKPITYVLVDRDVSEADLSYLLTRQSQTLVVNNFESLEDTI